MSALQTRHAERHDAAVEKGITPPLRDPRMRARMCADGRIAYPDVVMYRVSRWDEESRSYVPAETVPLPPTCDQYPDEHAKELARLARQEPRPVGLPYEAIIHDLEAYEWLKAHGLLDCGHRTPPGAHVGPVVDLRPAPGG